MNEQIVPVSGNQKSRFNANGAAPAAAMWKTRSCWNHTMFISLRFIFSARHNPSGRKISAHNMRTPCRWNRISDFLLNAVGEDQHCIS